LARDFRALISEYGHMIDSFHLKEFKQFNFGSMAYAPQPVQQRVHDSEASIIIVSGGEGSGKSKVTSAEIAARFGTWKRVLLVCYKTESARNEADYLYEFLNNFGAVLQYRTPKGGGLELTARDGAVVEAVSTYAEQERAVSGTGKSYDIIAMLEAGKQRYSVFLACLLRISRTAGLLILSGTIEKSEPWFPDIVTRLSGENELGAQVVIMPTWENHVLYPLGKDDPKIKQIRGELGEDLFMERCAGKPAPLHSLVFKEFSFLTHVFDWCQYDPKETVEAWIDPGYSGSHYSVNFVQFHPRAYTRQFKKDLPDAPLTDVFVIGDLYLDHAVHEEVIEQCKTLPWWSHVVGGVGDVVMKTHPMADRAPVDVWSAKANIFLRGQLIGIDDGIDRHHTFLKDPMSNSPRLFFNPNCQGVREYGRWKRKEVGENIFGDAEIQNCDCMKAISYGLIDHFGRVERLFPPRAISVGERIRIEEQRERLPEQPMAPGQTPMRIPNPQKQQYVVVKREPKEPVGGIGRGGGDKII
jgi:hypothetical protein